MFCRVLPIDPCNPVSAQLSFHLVPQAKITPLPKYRPLPSVWDSEDADLIERLLAFYPRKRPKRILDAAMNGGRFWRGSSRKIVGLDIERSHRPSIVGDNTTMPFPGKSFDVIVYDPPHIPNQGKDKQKDFNTRFGLGLRSPKEHGYSFAHLYPAFVQEAYRVLKPEGILLCKITDYIHDHQYQWAHVELIQAATAAVTGRDFLSFSKQFFSN